MIDHTAVLGFLLGTWVTPLVFVAIKFLRSWRMDRSQRLHNTEDLHRTLLRVDEHLAEIARRRRSRGGAP